MWRALSSVKAPLQGSLNIRHASSSTGGSRKIVLGVGSIVASAVGCSGLIVYGNYDPSFKQILTENVPLTQKIYQILENKDEILHVSNKVAKKDTENLPLSTGLLKKKVDKETTVEKEVEPKVNSKGVTPTKKLTDGKSVANSNTSKSEPVANEQILQSPNKKDFASQENTVLQMLDKLRKKSEETLVAQSDAVESIKYHTVKLREAVDLSEGNDDDLVWKQARNATSNKEKSLRTAKEKYEESKSLIEKLKENLKILSEQDPNNELLKMAYKSIDLHETKLNAAQFEMTSAETEAKNPIEYEHLVKEGKAQFEKELEIVLPKHSHMHHDKNKAMSVEDLNILIAHAHCKIEKLQKELARQKANEKLKVVQAIRNQKLQDAEMVESRVRDELKRRLLDLDNTVKIQISAVKAHLEAEFHQQLIRQAAAHADHLKEALDVQAYKLDQKHLLELEEKLLHQKRKFASETSRNMSRIQGILDFLKAKNELDKASKKYQELWLICQALNDKINLSTPRYGERLSLSNDIAAIRVTATENEFVNGVLETISDDIIEKGVFTSDALKHRFEKVKSVCKKVALIDENNDSLFRYFLSYVESLLVLDGNFMLPKDELKGKVAVDPKEWDTFDILNRVSFCLDNNDLEQSLRYANLLKGEPKAIAEDWIKEVKFYLETETAIKALIAHASAISVQAYH